MKNDAQKHSGFTIVEVAVVILVGGLLLTMLVNTFKQDVQQTNILRTLNKMQVIQAAIVSSVTENGALPCPAPLSLSADLPTSNADPDDPEFGWAPEACAGPGAIKIGAVPVRTLNISDEYSHDEWSNRFVYAVSTDLTNKTEYAKCKGPACGQAAINVYNENGNLIRQNAHFVVFSLGPDRIGAYPSLASDNRSQLAKGAGGPIAQYRTLCATAQYRNCRYYTMPQNNKGIIQAGSGYMFTQAPVAGRHDDYLLYHPPSDNDNVVIPFGYTAPFKLTACPPGWVQTDIGTSRKPNNIIFCQKR